MDGTSTTTGDENLTSDVASTNMADIRRITGDWDLTSNEADGDYKGWTAPGGTLSDDGTRVSWAIMSDTTTGTVTSGKVRGYTPGVIGSSPTARNLEAARRHKAKATTATEQHKTRLYLLGQVFGLSVHGAASEHIEELDDNQSEAFRYYEQAIRTGDQERAYLQAEITSLHGDVEALRLVILSQKALHQTIVSRAKYWFVKKKMNYPVWLKDAIQMLAQEES